MGSRSGLTAGVALGLLLGCLIGVAAVLPAAFRVSADHGQAGIGIRGEGAGMYAESADGVLDLTFSTNTETLHAGQIDVRNAGHEVWDGYWVTNATGDLDGPSDAALHDAIRVAINAIAVDQPCAAVGGHAVPVQGEPLIAQSGGMRFAGLETAHRMTINTRGAEERLCFYLFLDDAPSDVAGGSVSYTLTFTAQTSTSQAPAPTAPALPPSTPAPDGVEIDTADSDEVVVREGAAATVSVSAPDGSTATVSAPPDALPAGARLSVTAVADLPGLVAQAPPPDGRLLVAFVLEVVDAQGNPLTGRFNAPVDLEFTVAPGSVPEGAEARQFALVYWNGSEWVEPLSTAVVHAGGSVTLRASVWHFTIFAVLYQPDRGTFTVPPQPGVTLTMWRGGSLPLLEAAAPGARSFWVTEGGRFVGYIPGAPAWVNVDFFEIFPEGLIPAGRVMVVVTAR